MKQLFSRAIQILYNIYALLLFVVLMLIFFPFILAASFLGHVRGGNVIYRICCFWGDLWFPLIFIRHQNIFEEPLDTSKAQIFVANHVSYLDAALLVKTFRLPLRALGKAEIGKVPFFGFIYRRTIVTVNRSSATNRMRSVRVLKSVLGKGISVMVFPEGTFNETGLPLKGFYDGAFRIAIETGTPIRPVLFLDSWSRMPPGKNFALNPGTSRAVFLAEVPVQDYDKGDLAKLKMEVHDKMTGKLRAYQAPWIDD